MSHDQLKQEALDAVEQLFSDTSVDQETTAESLQLVVDACVEKMQALTETDVVPRTTAPKGMVGRCRECPWDKKCMPGWLGSEMGIEDWLKTAHSDASVECHTRPGQPCRGIADYRANMGKIPRDKLIPRGNKTDKVFQSPDEFRTHHSKYGKTSAEVSKEK